MKNRTEPSIRLQQDEQKREKEEAEASAREGQRQREEECRRHDSSSGKMSADQALEILGLKSRATEEEIRAAYNRLMKRVHPDVGGSSVFAMQLNRARDALVE
jgi:DnaJ-domain-containing protein 1